MENYLAQALLEALDIAVKRYVVQALVQLFLRCGKYLAQALLEALDIDVKR